MGSIAYPQNVNHESLKGEWEYKSPKGKSKLSYKFDVEQKFTSISEHKEKEVKTDGSYELDKRVDLDRLILTIGATGNSTRTQMSYHWIKFLSPDTIKLQNANDRQTSWVKETKRNTFIFIRKQEKIKNK